MNKPVSLGSLILDLQKIINFEFLYDYGKPKYGEKQNHVTWIQPVSLYT